MHGMLGSPSFSRTARHPISRDEYRHVPGKERQQLACCCTCGFAGCPAADKLSKAWPSVTPLEEGEQQPAGSGSQAHSSSIRLMLGSKQQKLSFSRTLQPIFLLPANRTYGLWACKKCAAEATTASALSPATTPLPPATQPPPPALPPPPLMLPTPDQAASSSSFQALPHYIATAPSSTPCVLQQQPQQQQQQVQSTVLTRGAKEELLADIDRRSGAWQLKATEYAAEIRQRSGERKQLVAELQQLKEAKQQELQQLLSDMQQQHARTTAELRVLRQAVQECIGGAPGKEVNAVKRSQNLL